MAMEELIVVFFMANVIVFCFSPANGKSAVGDPGFRNDERWAETPFKNKEWRRKD